ncbi:DUF998 domain-containing protein [Nocardia sp. NPDC059239]|uniref:DUF998 domain-containing protein n=1 Tax=unclassified Nocardia TaxID=2637762 RepID=UPI0036A52729
MTREASTYAAAASTGLFTLAYLVLGPLRPGYSQIADQISDLGVGRLAPVMNATFILSGLLLFGAASAIARGVRPAVGTSARWIAVLLTIPAIGQILCGIFTEARPTQGPHVLGAMMGFAIPVLAFPITGSILRRSPAYRRIGNRLLASGPLALIMLVIFFNTGAPEAAGKHLGIGGLTERIMVLHVQFWYIAISAAVLRGPHSVGYQLRR